MERNGQHETDKTASVEIAGAVVRGVVVEFAPTLKFLSEFLREGVVYGQNQRVRALRYQRQRRPHQVFHPV